MKNDYDEKYSGIPSEEEERIKYLFNLLNFRKKDLKIINKFYSALNEITTSSYKFILYLIPEASPRPRYSFRFHKFYVKNARKNNELFSEIVNTVGNLPMITTATKINIDSYLPTPKTMNKFEKYFAEIGLIKPVSIPDWDNLAKTYSDMIQKNIIINDMIIWSGISTKHYSIKPRIEITVTYDNSYDCNYNRKKIEKSKSYLDLYKDKFNTELNTVLDLVRKEELLNG